MRKAGKGMRTVFPGSRQSRQLPAGKIKQPEKQENPCINGLTVLQFTLRHVTMRQRTIMAAHDEEFFTNEGRNPSQVSADHHQMRLRRRHRDRLHQAEHHR